jgi:hypothetical protein
LHRARDLGLTGVALKDESVLAASSELADRGEQWQRALWLD